MEKHLGEFIQDALIAKGYKKQENGEFHGVGYFPELAGQFSNGRHVVRFVFADDLRWLESVDGWGASIKFVSLRDYYGAENYEAAALEILALFGV